jgi:hypothetical protein
MMGASSCYAGTGALTGPPNIDPCGQPVLSLAHNLAAFSGARNLATLSHAYNLAALSQTVKHLHVPVRTLVTTMNKGYHNLR